jgi:hypothetical protein
LSTRKLGALVEHLPRESSLFLVESGGASAWGPTDHLLASLIEVTDGVALRALSAQGAKRLPKPIRVERPAPGPRRKRRRATSEEMAAFFANARKGVTGGS